MEEVEFDPVKDARSTTQRGLPLNLAALVFEGRYIEHEDQRRDYGETRTVATGPIAEFGGRVCVVVYTWRNGSRRIISFRKANDREVRKYEASVNGGG